jgi:hypothetical protein
MSVAILINVILRNCLSPCGTSLELDVVDVDTSVDNVDVNTFTRDLVVGVFRERGEAEPLPVADTCKTLIAEMKRRQKWALNELRNLNLPRELRSVASHLGCGRSGRAQCSRPQARSAVAQ